MHQQQSSSVAGPLSQCNTDGEGFSDENVLVLQHASEIKVSKLEWKKAVLDI